MAATWGQIILAGWTQLSMVYADIRITVCTYKNTFPMLRWCICVSVDDYQFYISCINSVHLTQRPDSSRNWVFWSARQRPGRVDLYREWTWTPSNTSGRSSAGKERSRQPERSRATPEEARQSGEEEAEEGRRRRAGRAQPPAFSSRLSLSELQAWPATARRAWRSRAKTGTTSGSLSSSAWPAALPAARLATSSCPFVHSFFFYINKSKWSAGWSLAAVPTRRRYSTAWLMSWRAIWHRCFTRWPDHVVPAFLLHIALLLV